MDVIHTPVLLRECLDFLAPDEEQGASALLIDSTLGEGGHAEAFLKRFSNLRIIGLDADLKIQARARERLAAYGQRMVFYTVWFNDFFANFPIDSAPDRILFDLGISLFHFENSNRGFSFRSDEPLDMRLNEQSGISAQDIVNKTSEQELANILYVYGEERYSRRIARAIVLERATLPIKTAAHLARVVYSAVPAQYRRPLHPATKTFQAIRIAVNHELERLFQALMDSFNVLALGGRVGVITFHSLEDRIVKNFFRNLCKDCICPPEKPICICGGVSCGELCTKKAVLPKEDEVQKNAPSRSAKLRVIRKTRELSDAKKTVIEDVCKRFVVSPGELRSLKRA